jgi:DNA-binding transcriptional MerR regulator
MRGFRAAQVVELTGVNRKTLHYWAQSGFIRPSIADAHGTGSRRLYSFSDLLALRVARELRQAGVPLQSLRAVVRFLRERKRLVHPLADAFLLTDGKQVYLKEGREVVATLREPGQKLLFQVVDLARAVESLHEASVKLEARGEGGEEGPRRAV